MAYACPIHPKNTYITYNQTTPYLIGQCDVAMVTAAISELGSQIFGFFG